MTCYLFSIEGNIGSGKSTFIRYLKDKFQTISGYKVIYLSEPVKEWVEIKDAENETIVNLRRSMRSKKANPKYLSQDFEN